MKQEEKSRLRDPFWLGSLALVLLIMGLIFYFSAQTGAQSGGSSGRVDSVFLRCLFPDFGTLSPERQWELYYRLDFIVRKRRICWNLPRWALRCGCICRL